MVRVDPFSVYLSSGKRYKVYMHLSHTEEIPLILFIKFYVNFLQIFLLNRIAVETLEGYKPRPMPPERTKKVIKPSIQGPNIMLKCHLGG